MSKRKISTLVFAFAGILLLRIAVRLAGFTETVTIQVSIVALMIAVAVTAIAFYKWKWVSESQELPSKIYSWFLLVLTISTVAIDKLFRDPNDIPFFIGVALMFITGAWGISTRSRQEVDPSS